MGMGLVVTNVSALAKWEEWRFSNSSMCWGWTRGVRGRDGARWLAAQQSSRGGEVEAGGHSGFKRTVTRPR